MSFIYKYMIFSKIHTNLSYRQKQIISGTVLGGSSIISPSKGVTSYLSMRGKDYDWLQYKINSISCLSSEKSLFKEGETYRWHSRCHYEINNIKSMFYKNGKRHIGESSLDLLSDVALSVWFCDCGELCKDGTIININHWKGFEDIFLEYFKAIDINVSIKVERKNKIRIFINKENSDLLFKIIEPQIPVWFWKK